MNTKRTVTIEFTTAKEAALFRRWYRRNSTGFFIYLDNAGKWGKKAAKRKMEEWPKRCERFV